mmetsp:Transcript_1698/g.6223  ORF Transcript_1698/g.6223 Transcript_1698/m.6223 type:complete len:195 (+) Transcript_1698:695-1279(+)
MLHHSNGAYCGIGFGALDQVSSHDKPGFESIKNGRTDRENADDHLHSILLRNKESKTIEAGARLILGWTSKNHGLAEKWRLYAFRQAIRLKKMKLSTEHRAQLDKHRVGEQVLSHKENIRIKIIDGVADWLFWADCLAIAADVGERLPGDAQCSFIGAVASGGTMLRANEGVKSWREFTLPPHLKVPGFPAASK